MKIQKFNLPAVNPYKTNQLKAEQMERKSKMGTDKLEISTEAKQLSEASPITIERKERVEQLKAKIESGTYKVDAEQLASNLANYYKAKKE
ncbi:flagellar biosynthesis anti-sigma factor FlgM [Sporosarcina sp. NPDC096371]|uniref:flagellar biosynthesis anti-sigma factor FlgM n=1 Tax=Sporosarcina sp. NPDC096371 TaxID=3364530 RepID=UPI003806F113